MAGRALLAEGVTPTVKQAADRAGISRTTSYRYFRNQRELLLATYPELDRASLLAADAPSDPVARLDIVLANITRQVVENEAALRISLEVPPPPQMLRQGRAVRWIEDALSPLREQLGKAALHRLVLAIRATVGIEPFVWLTDVARLSRRDAVALMQASARTLLASAIAQPRRRR